MNDISSDSLHELFAALGDLLAAARVDCHLYAAADRREPRDFGDLRQLQPTSDELHARARWARSHNMPGPFDDAMARVLDDLGVQDEGRSA